MQNGAVEVRQHDEPVVCFAFCVQIVEERLRANKLVYEDFSIRRVNGRYTWLQGRDRDSEQIRANPVECGAIPRIHFEPPDCESLTLLGNSGRQMIRGPIILIRSAACRHHVEMMPALGKPRGDLPRMLLGSALDFATKPRDDD